MFIDHRYTRDFKKLKQQILKIRKIKEIIAKKAKEDLLKCPKDNRCQDQK